MTHPAPITVERLIETAVTAAGETIHYPSEGKAELALHRVTIQPGEATGWHRHGVPVAGYILQGEIKVDYGDGDIRIYKSGDAIVEAMDRWHNGSNEGSEAVVILAIYMGAEGLERTIPKDGPLRF